MVKLPKKRPIELQEVSLRKAVGYSDLTRDCDFRMAVKGLEKKFGIDEMLTAHQDKAPHRIKKGT